MQHIFQKGTDSNAPTLVLFHGTGGTEQDLLPLAKRISPASSVLSLRGSVTENGMPRFFKRLAEGVFDIEDLILRTREINEFLDQAAEQYKFDRAHLVAVGYSNGANIAGSLLFHYEHALKGAILHHPMVPRRGMELPNLAGTPVLIAAGTNDPICPPQESIELDKLLSEAGASVTLHWEDYGHQLTSSEVEAAASWFREQWQQD